MLILNLLPLFHQGRGAVTTKEKLAEMARPDVTLALHCDALVSSPGAHSLSVHETDAVSLPPRKSFLSGVNNAAQAQKRWKRSQARARSAAHTGMLEKAEAQATARLMGLSSSEFRRNQAGLTSFLHELRHGSRTPGTGPDGAQNGGGSRHGGGGGGGDGAGARAAALAERHQAARAQVFGEFSGILEASKKRRNVRHARAALGSWGSVGSGSLLSPGSVRAR